MGDRDFLVEGYSALRILGNMLAEAKENLAYMWEHAVTPELLNHAFDKVKGIEASIERVQMRIEVYRSSLDQPAA